MLPSPSTVSIAAAVGLHGEHQAGAHAVAVDAAPCRRRTRRARSRHACRSGPACGAGNRTAAGAARRRARSAVPLTVTLMSRRAHAALARAMRRERAPREHADQMPPVVGRGVQVGVRRRRPHGRLRSRRRSTPVSSARADQQRLGLAGASRRRRDARHGDARLRDRAVGQRQRRRRRRRARNRRCGARPPRNPSRCWAAASETRSRSRSRPRRGRR